MIFWEICFAQQLAKYIFMPATAISLDGKKVFSVKWMALVYIFYILQWFGYQPKWLNKSTCSGGLPTTIYNTGLATHWFFCRFLVFFSRTVRLSIALWNFSPCHRPCVLQIGKAENRISFPRIQFRRVSFLSGNFPSPPVIKPTPERLVFFPLKIHDYTQTLSPVWKPKEHPIPCHPILWEEDFYPTTHYKTAAFKPMKIQQVLMYLKSLLRRRLDVIRTISKLSHLSVKDKMA